MNTYASKSMYFDEFDKRKIIVCYTSCIVWLLCTNCVLRCIYDTNWWSMCYMIDGNVMNMLWW